jgi:hypothetical protein
MAAQSAAFGFSAHSGWAAMVVLGSASSSLSVLARSRVELIDDHDPESKQPYHAVESLCVEEVTAGHDVWFTGSLGVAAIRACV